MNRTPRQRGPLGRIHLPEMPAENSQVETGRAETAKAGQGRRAINKGGK